MITSMIATTASTGNQSTSSFSAAQHRIHSLGVSLSSIERCTTEAGRCCDTISRLARQLDSLTSPASDASAILTQASENLASTLWRIKDAREKFDTVPDCEPAIQRLASGAKEAMEASISIHQRNATAAAISSTPNAVSSAAGATSLNRRGGISSGGGEEDDEIDAALFSNKLSTFLTEQDIHAAADSMDILRDAYAYFLERPKWKSSPSTLRNIERVHREGVNSMALLLKAILTAAGPACRLKSTAANISTNMSSVTNKKTSAISSRYEHETAQDTRRRLTDALQKKDLLKSVGEYEDILPLDSASLREIRAIMECLRGDNNNNGSYLGASSVSQPYRTQPQQALPSDIPPGTKVVRTEKVGSGFYSNLSKRPINTGYPLLDAYGEARKMVALASLENFHRQLKAEQKKKIARQPRSSSAAATAASQVSKSITATAVVAGGGGTITNTTAATSTTAVDVDTAARDAVRCLEHAMVVVAGEKTIYRSIISKTVDSSKEPLLSTEYTSACVHAYSFVVSAVVDRAMDIIELVFFKEAGIGQHQQQQQQHVTITTVPTSTSDGSEVGAGSPSTLLSIRSASSAAAAGLRILDGVRILGPSLAKLCELSEYRGDSQQLLAGQLCISIHRTTVKQCARTLENLVKAIQTESSDGDQYTLSSNVVRAIRIISPFVHAYKSVSKRRLVTIDNKIY